MAICSTPVSSVAASRYCRPCSFTSVTISTAIAAVAAEIMPGRPPTKATTTAMQNEAYSPTLGSTPAMIENAMASGIRASATTMPASRSPRMLVNQFCRIELIMLPPEKLCRPAWSARACGQVLECLQGKTRRAAWNGERTKKRRKVGGERNYIGRPRGA